MDSFSKSKATLDQCAVHLNAAFKVFMLHHPPIKAFAALQGTCHALKDMVDGVPSDILLTAVRSARLLPPVIAEHLSSSQSLQALLSRHAAVVRQLRSGACTSLKHLQLKSNHCVEALKWPAAAQPLLAYLVCMSTL